MIGIEKESIVTLCFIWCSGPDDSRAGNGWIAMSRGETRTSDCPTARRARRVTSQDPRHGERKQPT